MAKPALGRGLGALLGGNPVAKAPVAAPNTSSVLELAPEPFERVQKVALDRIQPCAFQPRQDFSPEALRELADSIREQGIVQPLIVRERNGHLELIAGERRWRAAQMLGLTAVPVIIREAEDRVALELALIENLQRENLNPIEEAQGYVQLMEQFQLKQEDVAAKVGKSRAAVANAVRLLKLPLPVQVALREGRLSVGHAKVILSLESDTQRQLAAARITRDTLNVRQTEALVARWQTGAAAPVRVGSPAAAQTDPHLAAIESRLRERLGTKVSLKYAQGKGTVEITFFSDDELERLLELLGIQVD